MPRTRAALAVLARNIRAVTADLPAPLALEHVAALARWPDHEFGEADFLAELVERTGVSLLLDLANLHADVRNHGTDPAAFLDRLPLDAVAYVHVAGGIERDGLYHDTHTHPVGPAVTDLVAELAARCDRMPPIMLERDGDYPPAVELDAELATLARPAQLAARPASWVRAPTDRTAQSDPTAEPDPTAENDLARRQADLVGALVAGGADPAGFDRDRLAATRRALLRKRAGAVAKAWPALSVTDGFTHRFTAFAAGRPALGPRADGLAFATSIRADLDGDARAELRAATRRRWPTRHRR